MKLKILNKKNKIYLGILLGLISIIILFLLGFFIYKEIENYKNADNDIRMSDVLLVSFNKEITILRDVIIKYQASTNEERISMGDLIYDFSKHEYIPILNYLNNVSSDEDLLNGMNEILDFITDVNLSLYNERSDIISKNKNGKSFTKVDNKYIYLVKKKYISKDEFNLLYDEYLNTKDYANVNNYFIDIIFNKLSNKYSLEMLENEIKNNYDEFYKENEEVITSIIGNDLNEFANYCLNNYIKKVYDENGNYIGRELIKNIKTEDMEVEYVFTRLNRIYNSVSKYYRYSYQLDLNYLWEQLDEMNLPFVYC